jgi:hypothetical protein
MRVADGQVSVNPEVRSEGRREKEKEGIAATSEIAAGDAHDEKDS